LTAFDLLDFAIRQDQRIRGKLQFKPFDAMAIKRLFLKLPLAERISRPFETFRRLQREFSGSHAGWSGQADAEAWVGMQGLESEPFTARNRFRRALELYRRAGEPKRLLLATRFGHAEDGLTPGFAERLGDRLKQMLDP
jgi:hypothetical protein